MVRYDLQIIGDWAEALDNAFDERLSQEGQQRFILPYPARLPAGQDYNR